MNVILIGDSIRMAYEPVVAELLDGRAEVWGPEVNGGDSRNVLANLDEWVIGRHADVVHVNCGLHDLRDLPDAGFQVPLGDYAANVTAIMERLMTEWSGEIIWATTTPVIEEVTASPGRDFARRQADVDAYNSVALEVMTERGIRVNDLHAVVSEAGVSKCVCSDGVHMQEYGNRLLAQAVAAAVMASA